MDAARQMGFEFRQRTQTGVTLRMLGQEVTYEILNVMEYTSDRCARWRWGGAGSRCCALAAPAWASRRSLDVQGSRCCC